MQKTKAYIKCSHPERNEWSHITAKNKHMIEQWALISPYCSLPSSWYTSYVISTHPSPLPINLLPTVYQHWNPVKSTTFPSAFYKQFYYIHFFFTILNTLLISFIFPSFPQLFFVFCSLKILSWGDKCWWISQFLRCLPAFVAFLRWHFESRFYQYFIICFPYIRWAWCSDSFLSNIFNGWRYY